MRAAPRCGHASIAQIASLHILFVRLLPRPSLVTSRRTSYSKSNKVCLSVFSCEPKLDSLHVSLELSRHSFTSISVLRCGHQRSAKKDNSTQRIMNVLTFCVALAALVARAGAQCSSVLAVAEAQNLTQLVAGIELVKVTPPEPTALVVTNLIQSDKESGVKYTIFSPSDSAFSTSFPGGITDADIFWGVLGSHAFSGTWDVATLVKDVQATAILEIRKKSLNGKTIVFTATNETNSGLWVRLSDQEATPVAKVVVADVASCLGTLHVINRVMLPDGEIPGMEEAIAPGPGALRGAPLAAPPPILAPIDPAPEGCVSFTAAANTSGLADFVAVVAEVEGDPSGAIVSTAISAEAPLSSQFTVFAPENTAVRSGVNNETSPAQLIEVLSNHMVSGVYSYDELLSQAADGGFSGLVLQTVNGGSLKLTTDGSNLWVIPEGSDPSIAPATIVRKDIETCAGVMHVVDALLAPSGMKIADSPLSQPNVVDIPSSAPRFFEDPEEGSAIPPGDAAKVEVGEDASQASRCFHWLPSLSTAAIVSVAVAFMA